jgi:hypothetical protein
MINKTDVVDFDQRTGAPYTVCWSNLHFLLLSLVLMLPPLLEDLLRASILINAGWHPKK